MKEYFLFGLVVALLLISIVQALQINEIKGQITGQVTAASQPSQPQPQQQQPLQQPASQPSMVGGC